MRAWAGVRACTLRKVYALCLCSTPSSYPRPLPCPPPPANSYRSPSLPRIRRDSHGLEAQYSPSGNLHASLRREVTPTVGDVTYGVSEESAVFCTIVATYRSGFAETNVNKNVKTRGTRSEILRFLREGRVLVSATMNNLHAVSLSTLVTLIIIARYRYRTQRALPSHPLAIIANWNVFINSHFLVLRINNTIIHV